MTTLYLLRHGQSEANAAGVFCGQRTDASLSVGGRAEVEAQAAVLDRLGLTALYTSPLDRAAQTAAIVGEHTGLAVSRVDELLEVDIGELDGRPAGAGAWAEYDAVRKRWEQGESTAAFPAGESLDDIRSRLSRLFERNVDGQPGPVMLVGHGMLFMALLWLVGVNRAPDLQGNYMMNAHLTMLSGKQGRYTIEHFNLPPGTLPPQLRLA